MKTGNLEIRCNAMAREVLISRAGIATGVSYVDKKTSKEVQVRGRIVVLAASACEPARLLLNSKIPSHPDGLANSAGCVGKYLMDSVGVNSAGFFPIRLSTPPHNEDGAGGMHLYMPWWNYQKQCRHELPFSRGFHIEFGGGVHMPEVGTFTGKERFLDGYGLELRRKARSIYGAFIGFDLQGEMIPNELSYCEIDKNVVDEWDIAVLQFHFKWSEEEIRMAKYGHEIHREITLTAGGEPLRMYGPEDNWGISPGGRTVHEVGAARMGADRSTSVLNSYCQAWDCKNLFITAGAPFVSNADKNPTLTILALAWRTSDYVADQVKKRNV